MRVMKPFCSLYVPQPQPHEGGCRQHHGIIPVTLSLSMYTQTGRHTETSSNTEPLRGNPASTAPASASCNLTAAAHCGCILRLTVVSCNAPSQPREAGRSTRTHASQEQAHCRCSALHTKLASRVLSIPTLATTGGWPCGCKACKRHMTLCSCGCNNSRPHQTTPTHTIPAAGARCSCSARTATHTLQQLPHTLTPQLL